MAGWQFNLAAEALSGTPSPIITIATEVGYGSEAAFTRGFSRQYGSPPAE